ncbi:hypothetical protein HDV06_006334 [Boothiomyces sp. JEL0866]|nr:hypothetical protein HDV06_006334 [Boothiomyces sp. JEL0866]
MRMKFKASKAETRNSSLRGNANLLPARRCLFTSSKCVKKLENIPGQFVFTINQYSKPIAVGNFSTTQNPQSNSFKYRKFTIFNEKSSRHQQWKNSLIDYLSLEYSFLAEAFILDLNTITDGIYSLGSGSECDEPVIKKDCPTCPSLLGYIFKSGTDICNLTMLENDYQLDLIPGAICKVNERLKIKVTRKNRLVLIDLARSAYTNILDRRIDLFFEYDPKLCFYGTLDEQTLMVKIRDREVCVHYSPEGGYQVFFSDLLAEQQKYMDCRVVSLSIRDTKIVVDFNYSYPVPNRKGIPLNRLEWKIEGGLNPKYF